MTEYRVSWPFLIFSGVYAFILTTTDYAKNHKLSRRFVFHDTSSQVLKRPQHLKVTSASSNTDFTWITEVAVTGTTSVVLNWTDHFFNHDHKVKGILWEIKNHTDVSNGKH